MPSLPADFDRPVEVAHPYQTAAIGWLKAGWSPIPVRDKRPLVAGHHGKSGKSVTRELVNQWRERYPTANLAVRLPDGVIGIDVDAYDDKQGAVTLAQLEQERGPLPATVTTTARDDGISGIRWYRVRPAAWLSVAGPGIEIVHAGNRYVVAPPSIHHNGQPYRFEPERTTPPSPDDLAALPEAWVARLTRTPRVWVNGIASQAQFTGGVGHPRGLAILKKEVETDWPAAAGTHGWNNALYASSKRIFELVAGGWLADEATESALVTMACQADPAWEPDWIAATVASGRQEGLRNPRSLAPTPEVTPPVTPVPAQEGLAILDEVRAFLLKYVSYPNDWAVTAHALWIVHTHAMDAWDSTPRIAFLSPEKGSGKTRALEVTAALVPNHLHAFGTSSAAMFRVLSRPERPTILHDEIDTVFGPKAADHEDLRAVLNSGHRRGAVALRCTVEGKKIAVEELPSYCAVALAGLGNLPDTISSRSILVRMRRRAPSEPVTPWRARECEPQAHAIRDRIAGWVPGVLDVLREARPVMPDTVTDRDADVWEPLMAVADVAAAGRHVAGVAAREATADTPSDWAALSRVAAVAAVASSGDEEQTIGVQLLTDLELITRGDNAWRFRTVSIIQKLQGVEEGVWRDLNGRMLTAQSLAVILKPYGIKAQKWREGNRTERGYLLSELEEAWSRYLPSYPPPESRHNRHNRHGHQEGLHL